MQTFLRRALGSPVVALGGAVVLGVREFVALQSARRAVRRLAGRARGSELADTALSRWRR